MSSNILKGYPGISVALQYFGLAVFTFYTLKFLYKILSNLYVFTLGSVNFKKYGKWAVVTGCTDGIGKAYAEKLAKKGLNVVLISRSIDKLNELSESIKSKYKVDTLVISADFTEENSIYGDIKSKIQGLEVGVLVNNVGMSYNHPDFLETLDEKTINNLIHCNIVSVTKLSAIVLPGMAKRKAGVIINNASASGRTPTPLLTIYSATKAYVDFFSRGLAKEYESKGIIVQSLCPFFVATKLAKMRSSLFVPSPNQYVDSAIKTIGSQEVTNGCLLHNLQGWVTESILPESVFKNISFNNLMATRKRALKKLDTAKKD